jgi:hypothetical protein
VVAFQITRIRQAMESGKTVILLNCEKLHESLCKLLIAIAFVAAHRDCFPDDLLNQQYRKVATKLYCRIALGSHSMTCAVSPGFKCIVVRR